MKIRPRNNPPHKADDTLLLNPVYAVKEGHGSAQPRKNINTKPAVGQAKNRRADQNPSRAAKTTSKPPTSAETYKPKSVYIQKSL